mmetsp:Transcript_27219/g.64432  ORF Transcript_27219/g.64432 Transcript_27219/m.64432 type:complete len:288 (+) Transcript_27219:1490-2353(+)
MASWDGDDVAPTTGKEGLAMVAPSLGDALTTAAGPTVATSAGKTVPGAAMSRMPSPSSSTPAASIWISTPSEKRSLIAHVPWLAEHCEKIPELGAATTISAPSSETPATRNSAAGEASIASGGNAAPASAMSSSVTPDTSPATLGCGITSKEEYGISTREPSARSTSTLRGTPTVAGSNAPSLLGTATRIAAPPADTSTTAYPRGYSAPGRSTRRAISSSALRSARDSLPNASPHWNPGVPLGTAPWGGFVLVSEKGWNASSAPTASAPGAAGEKSAARPSGFTIAT